MARHGSLATTLAGLLLASAPCAHTAPCPSLGIDSHPDGYVLTNYPGLGTLGRLIAPDCSVTTVPLIPKAAPRPATPGRPGITPISPSIGTSAPPTQVLTIKDVVIARVHRLPDQTQELAFTKCPTFADGADLTNARGLTTITINDCPSIETLDNVQFPDGVTYIGVQNTNLKSIKNVVWPLQLERLFLGSNKLTSIESNYPEFMTTVVLRGNPVTTLDKGSFPRSLLSITLPSVTSIKGIAWPPNMLSLWVEDVTVTEFEVRESDLEGVSQTFYGEISQSACSDPTATVQTVDEKSFCVISDERFDAKYRPTTDAPTIEVLLPPTVAPSTNGTTIPSTVPQPVSATTASSGSGPGSGSVGDGLSDDILFPGGKSGMRGRNPVSENDTQDTEDMSGNGDGTSSSRRNRTGGGKSSPSSSTVSARSPTSPSDSSPSDGGATKTSLSSSTVTRAAIIAVISALAVFALFVVGKRRSAQRKMGLDGSESPTYYTLPTTPHGENSFVGDGSEPALVGFLANDVRNDEMLAPFILAASDVTLGNTVARGGFGVVIRGVYHGRDVAVKQMQPDTRRDEAALARFMDEIRLSAKLKHAKIVEFVGISWTSLRDLSVVSEFMGGGDLHDALRKQPAPSPVDWTETWSAAKLQGKATIARDVAEAVVYLHSRTSPVLHRDLKARNVLLDDRGNAKLSDFGISREVVVDETLTGEIGTVAWIAPEVLRGERYSAKADIYSFGVLLVEMDRCRHPYDASTGMGQDVEADEESASPTAVASHNAFQNANIILLVSTGKLRPELSADCPSGIKSLAEQCLSFDPTSRPTANEVVQRLDDILVGFSA